MELNSQKPTSVSHDTTVWLHSTFVTVQGEGPLTGRRAVFVRFAGCNLQCPLCDTEYTAGAKQHNASALVRALIDKHTRYGTYVVTGGEPFRQPFALYLLCKDLLEAGKHVQIETNGKLGCGPHYSGFAMLKRMHGSRFQIVVSPKTARVHDHMHELADAWKYVVDATPLCEADMLPVSALNHPVPAGHTIARPRPSYTGPIYVNPADEQSVAANAANHAAALRVVHAGDDRRLLGVQLHKIYGLE
jgi:organic radical activating enzyme